MYSPQGFIAGACEQALADAGFKAYWGADARTQSPDMPDVLLHETAVGMFRKRLRREKPVVAPWLESVEQWSERAGKVVQHMNANYDLDGLCRRFPERLNELLQNSGERLPT